MVILFDVVGVGNVLQQIPRAVTAEPPSEDMLPPLIALLPVIDVIVLVVSVGNVVATEVVVKVISLPYAVPALFVAYARA